MEVVVEKLKKEELREAVGIYDINHDLVTDYDKLFSIYDDIYNNEAYHNIVAKVNGEIVGLATVIVNYDIVDQLKPFLTIWNFGIKKEFRRKKIGTEMFRYINQFAKLNDCCFICLIAEKDNVIAQSFYESLGFEKEVGYLKAIVK